MNKIFDLVRELVKDYHAITIHLTNGEKIHVNRFDDSKDNFLRVSLFTKVGDISRRVHYDVNVNNITYIEH